MLDMLNMPAGVMVVGWVAFVLILRFVIMALAVVYETAQKAKEFFKRANNEQRPAQEAPMQSCLGISPVLR